MTEGDRDEVKTMLPEQKNESRWVMCFIVFMAAMAAGYFLGSVEKSCSVLKDRVKVIEERQQGEAR